MVTQNDINLRPQNIEAEKGVLCGALMDAESIWIYE
jgi:hypothetical protein